MLAEAKDEIIRCEEHYFLFFLIPYKGVGPKGRKGPKLCPKDSCLSLWFTVVFALTGTERGLGPWGPKRHSFGPFEKKKKLRFLDTLPNIW